MKLKKYLNNALLLTLVTISVIFSMGALRIYETGTINADGSGTISLTYSAKTSDIKANNNLIGNFSFTQQGARDIFTSANTKVKNATVYKKKDDSSFTSVTVVIEFKKVENLNETKGFAGMNIGYVNSDKGKLFRWVISPAALSEIDQILCQLTFECESVTSPTGNVKDKTVTYFKDDKKGDFTKEVIISALVKTDGKTTQSTDTAGKSEGDGKSCGLFGMELPLLLLGGLILNYTKRKKIK